jgi:DNA damage-inducible protein 1
VQITITNGIDLQTIDIDQEMTLEDLKALIEADLKVPIPQQQCFLNNVLLQGNGQSLKSLGITPDDIILVQATPSPAEQARQQILTNPTLRQQFIRVV